MTEPAPTEFALAEFPFPDQTLDSAPPEAQRQMKATASHLGYLPAALARMAISPQLMDGFFKANGLFEQTTLDPLARETLVMTMAVRNGCHICVAMHTASLTRLGADARLIADLRAGRPVADERLAAIQRFIQEVLETAGAVSDQQLAAFFRLGYTPRQALEVVLGIGAFTISTLANRMTRSPVDEQLSAVA
jgi:AhpD family alkylhydroperoxidase